MIELYKGVYVVEGMPVLFIKKLNALVCSDLHLGYEGVMADRGIFLPKTNLAKIKEILKKSTEITGAKKLIIDGDIKNEFSKVHMEEFNEFRELVSFLKELDIEELHLVKGNHDNFIDRFERPFGIKIYRQEFLLKDVLFFHGEELPASDEGKLLVMGHLHPAVGIFNKLGVKEKVKCFLYGKMADKRDIIILPAMNYFSEGIEVNISNIDDTPVFRRMLNLMDMNVVGIDYTEAVKFGSVRELADIL